MSNDNETPSPPSEDTEDEDILYRDGDDAQSFIQPAISPVQTRLTLPKVLAAERAAAMAQLEGGAGASSDGADDQELYGPRHTKSMPISQRQAKILAGSSGRDGTVPPSPRQPNQGALARLPSPWHPGAKEFVIEDLKRKPALSGVFGSSTRIKRASSIGDSAMRRLSKAFDSVNLPNFSSSSFFSTTNKDDHPISSSDLTRSPATLQKVPNSQNSPQPDSKSSGRDGDVSNGSLTLQRTLSDDSALYHSLSHVSSYGDDERWTHIREQVNVRLKAIKDSWDAPTFKLPSKFTPPPPPQSTPTPMLTIFRHIPRLPQTPLPKPLLLLPCPQAKRGRPLPLPRPRPGVLNGRHCHPRRLPRLRPALLPPSPPPTLGPRKVRPKHPQGQPRSRSQPK